MFIVYSWPKRISQTIGHTIYLLILQYIALIICTSCSQIIIPNLFCVKVIFVGKLQNHIHFCTRYNTEIAIHYRNCNTLQKLQQLTWCYLSFQLCPITRYFFCPIFGNTPCNIYDTYFQGSVETAIFTYRLFHLPMTIFFPNWNLLW